MKKIFVILISFFTFFVIQLSISISQWYSFHTNNSVVFFLICMVCLAVFNFLIILSFEKLSNGMKVSYIVILLIQVAVYSITSFECIANRSVIRVDEYDTVDGLTSYVIFLFHTYDFTAYGLSKAFHDFSGLQIQISVIYLPVLYIATGLFFQFKKKYPHTKI